jgi:hypothetical protein
MSNSASVVTSFQHTPPAGGRFVCLRSAAVSKLVCLELATDPREEVPPELREALTKLAHDGANALPVWIALDSAAWISTKMEERERLDDAMRLLIMRRANYNLLWRLFRITRQRWSDLREELGAPPLHASRVPAPDNDVINKVYNTWHRLTKEYPDEVDRWVLLVTQLPHVPVPALYRLIYDEAE